MEVADLNRLRRRLKAAWAAPGERPRAQMHLADVEGNHEDVLSAFRTIASEMGLRHIQIDLSGGLTSDHEETLARKAPRIVVMTSIEGMPTGERPGLHDRIAATARTLPVIVGFLPQEQIDAIHAGWHHVASDRT